MFAGMRDCKRLIPIMILLLFFTFGTAELVRAQSDTNGLPDIFLPGPGGGQGGSEGESCDGGGEGNLNGQGSKIDISLFLGPGEGGTPVLHLDSVGHYIPGQLFVVSGVIAESGTSNIQIDLQKHREAAIVVTQVVLGDLDQFNEDEAKVLTLIHSGKLDLSALIHIAFGGDSKIEQISLKQVEFNEQGKVRETTLSIERTSEIWEETVEVCLKAKMIIP